MGLNITIFIDSGRNIKNALLILTLIYFLIGGTQAQSTCSSPTNLNVSNILANSVDLGWTDTAFVWQIEWGPNGFIPGSGSFILTSSNHYNLNGLFSNSTYDFYVRTLCGIGDTSIVAGPVTFTTACHSVDLGDSIMFCQFHLPQGGAIDAGSGANFTYLWSTGDTTQIIAVDTAGVGFFNPFFISVTVIDTMFGCIALDTVSVIFDICGGINENKNNIRLSVYPNPNNGLFALNINAIEASELEIKVRNLQGQIVFSKPNFEEIINLEQIIDLKEHSKGIYFVTVTSDKGTATTKLIIE